MNSRYKSICLFACGLTLLCGGLAPSPVRAQNPIETNVEPVWRPVPDMLMLNARIALHAPEHPLLLGKSNELALEIKGTALPDELVISQCEIVSGIETPWIEDGYQQVQLERHPDGHTYVNFVPVRPGHLELNINASFSDGAFGQATVQVDVIAGEPPLKLQIDQFNQASTKMTFDLSEKWRTQRIFVGATYAGLEHPIPLAQKDVTFEVTTPRGKSPIQFDPATGTVDALRIGRALITAKYQGLEQKLCVLVNENADAVGVQKIKHITGVACENDPRDVGVPAGFREQCGA